MPQPNVGDTIYVTATFQALVDFSISRAAAALMVGQALRVNITNDHSFGVGVRVRVPDPTNRRPGWWLKPEHFSTVPPVPPSPVSSRPPPNVRKRKLEPLNLP